MEDQDQISDAELRRRVLYSLLMPPVRLGARFALPLKELLDWVQTAAFQEQRTRGATLPQIAERLGVSHRTAVRLSRQLRESFFMPELAHNLPRRLEFMLWAQPMSEARLLQVLPELDPAQLRDALDLLLREGRIQERHGRTLQYEACANVRRLPRDTWMARIGALNSLLDNVTHATFARFFRADPHAFARTLTLQLRPEDLPRLQEFYEQQLIPFLTELSSRANPEDDELLNMQLSLLWAPYEYLEHDPEPPPPGDAP